MFSGHAASTVRAWGQASEGQGNVPAGLNNAVAVAAGGLHSLALRSDGTVVAWGWYLFGETNVPPGLAGVVAIDGNFGYSVAVRSNGTVVSWGAAPAGMPPGLTNVSAVSAGWDHTLALLRNGTVVSWGNAPSPPEGLTNVIGIATGSGHSLAVKSDGRVVAWGNDVAGKTNVPPSLMNVVAVAAGDNHNLALRSNGTVAAWGENDRGQATVPAGLSNVIAIAAGSAHSLALRADGTVALWGSNDSGQSSQPPNLTGVIGLSGGTYHNLALVGDGSPVITGQPLSQTIILTRDVTFRVFVTGSQPLGYQWSRHGTNLAGATRSVLQLSNVQLTDAGPYQVTIINGAGTVVSVPAILTVVPMPPSIVTQPQDATTLCGEGATFRVTADGSKPLVYQWRFEGVDLVDATRSSLTLTAVTTNQAGNYSVVITNDYGALTSRLAQLTITIEPPAITSPLAASGKQGDPFTYTIRGRHSPNVFSALGLPAGVAVNATNGVIDGIPLQSGVFDVLIGTANACASDAQVLALTITSSVPVITSPLTVTGTEGLDFTYQITATDAPTSFGATNLPVGLRVAPETGIISGRPVYPGEFQATILASNLWGIGSAMLSFSFTNRPIDGLAIADVTYNYSSPYLLDFQFSLRDNEDPALANPVVMNPTNLIVTCLENGRAISPTETAYILAPGAGIRKLVKAELVLDFSQSIASLSNGDTNDDGISDAVDLMVGGAQEFVNQLTPGSQVGVFEFHREDMDPQQVIGLTADQGAVNGAIAGIWTNYVDWFPAGSRCWDALVAAIGDLGAANADEQHYVVFVSDGRDESSDASVEDVISAATNANVRIFCIGFGAELDPTDLLAITAGTSGRYYTATNVADLANEFAQISKDIGGQYILRWATLKRGANEFMPEFIVNFGSLWATSPPNPFTVDVDTNSTPPVTNYITNFIIGPYLPSDHAGDVTVGSLRLVRDAQVGSRAVTLRATYLPRYIRQLRLNYRPNWPCTPTVLSSAPGEILHNWTMTETNDGAGGRWLHLSSPNPQSLTNSLPYGAFASLIRFDFRDLSNASNAFSAFAVDNTIYTNTGRQSFLIENTNEFVKVYPALPYGTPVPWLLANGFTTNFTDAEISDPDLDGALTWMEYQADTNPKDPNSVFTVGVPTPDGLYGHYQIMFATSANRTYRVEFSTDLVFWEIMQDNIRGTGGVVSVSDPRNPSGVPHTYYRVRVW